MTPELSGDLGAPDLLSCGEQEYSEVEPSSARSGVNFLDDSTGIGTSGVPFEILRACQKFYVNIVPQCEQRNEL